MVKILKQQSAQPITNALSQRGYGGTAAWQGFGNNTPGIITTGEVQNGVSCIKVSMDSSLTTRSSGCAIFVTPRPGPMTARVLLMSPVAGRLSIVAWGSSSNDAVTVLPAGTWTWVTWTWNETISSSRRFGFGNLTGQSITDFYIAEVQVAYGSTVPVGMADGDTPGWRWTGAAGASTSVGLPYTLESIAGRPIAFQEGLGDTATSGFSALGPRMLYTVYNVQTNAANYGALGQLGIDIAAGSVRIQSAPTGVDTMGHRADFIGGSTNLGNFQGGGTRSLGRHISWLSVNDGMTQFNSGIDSASVFSSLPATPGSGMSSNPVLRVTSGSGQQGVAAFAYQADHNLETRKRILAWLTRRYNIVPPA